MVIFDFDQTLVDTSSLARLRTARRWSEVNRRARRLTPYPGITELLGELRAGNVTMGIVTTSPSMVAEGFVARHDWPIDTVVGYHDVSRSRLKPHPDALLLAIGRCEADPVASFHVGDRPEDTEASRRAGVVAIGAGWGSEDIAGLRESNPHHLFMSVAELLSFFKEHLTRKTMDGPHPGSYSCERS